MEENSVFYQYQYHLKQLYDLKDKVDELREQVVETAAEANEELMDAYLNNGELTREQIVNGLRLQTLSNEIVLSHAVQLSKIKAFRQC